jgi:hypothetical protein
MSTHRREWFCSECKGKVFTTNAELTTHLADVHHIQNVSRLPHLTAACQRPIRNFVQGSCPLCDDWTPSAYVGENTNDFRRHLGHHLQQLALSALPQFIHGLELLDDELAKSIALEGELKSCVNSLNDPTVNERSGADGNALQAASLRGHEQVVKLLLEKNADVNAQGGHYGNALQATSYNGHEQVVKLLLEKNADVNAQGGTFGNALQATSHGGHEQVVKLLLDKGATRPT